MDKRLKNFAPLTFLLIISLIAGWIHVCTHDHMDPVYEAFNSVSAEKNLALRGDCENPEKAGHTHECLCICHIPIELTTVRLIASGDALSELRFTLIENPETVFFSPLDHPPELA